jgi:ABC-type dipeptide/oligopeptide/nickel transport system ATPase subunit
MPPRAEILFGPIISGREAIPEFFKILGTAFFPYIFSDIFARSREGGDNFPEFRPKKRAQFPFLGVHEIQLGSKMVPMRNYVAGFQFTGTGQQKYISDLSGGERNRIHLAKMLKSDVNVLLLDGM